MNDRNLAKAALSSGSPTIAKVLKGETCAGCGLCAGVSRGSIEMVIDDKGFARPNAQGPVAEDSESLIAAACPGAVVEGWQQRSGGSLHPVWGPYSEIVTAHAVETDTRFAGSSGGVLSAIARYALDSGRVDAIVQINGDAEDPLKSRVTVSRDTSAVIAAAGSRYAPSPVLSSVGVLLDSTERYLFIGKPCDVSALRRLAKCDARVDDRFPIKLSFFCGGVPSEHGTLAVLSHLGLAGTPLTDLRYRGQGWPGRFAARTADGRAESMSYAQSWGAHLSSRVQYRCKICPDSVGGVADLAAADAWYGGETGYPQFDEADGRSLVMLRSAAGAELWRAAIADGACLAEPLPVGEIAAMQPGQSRRKRLVGARTLAARLLLQPLPRMDGLMIDEAGQTARWQDRLRNLLGSMRRIVLGKR